MQIKGIIFDLDGTLLDSMKIWDTIGNDYLESLGIETEENLAETFKVMSLKQAAEYYQTVYGVNKSIDEIISGINEMIARFYREQAELKEGVKDFLDKCLQKNIALCIATATDRALVEAALRRLEVLECFKGIFTCNEVGYGKDSPVIFEKALSLLGTSKEETIVFEDALHAIWTAKQAGFRVVGVYDSSENEQEALQKITDKYVLSLKDFKF